jgi:hypothetical protein
VGVLAGFCGIGFSGTVGIGGLYGLEDVFVWAVWAYGLVVASGAGG